MAVSIDYTIWNENKDPKRIYIADVSDWDTIEDLDSFIDITPPGKSVGVTFIFEKNTLNVITAETINLQPGGVDKLIDLPDGIYQIKVYGTPNTYSLSKQYLRTTQFWIKYYKILLARKSTCDTFSQTDQDAFIRITFLMKAAMAAVNLGDWCRAEELYKEAEKLLKNLDCNGLLCREAE